MKPRRKRTEVLTQNGHQESVKQPSNGQEQEGQVSSSTITNGSLEDPLPGQSNGTDDNQNKPTQKRASKRHLTSRQSGKTQTSIEILPEDEDEDEENTPTTSKRSKRKQIVQFAHSSDEDEQISSLSDEVFYDNHGYPGHLLCLKLYQFMCHDRFEFKFNPRVNVINGENGSKFLFILSFLFISSLILHLIETRWQIGDSHRYHANLRLECFNNLSRNKRESLHQKQL